ncbi:MAG: glutamate-5-semialdehyde dehydrogenase [Anaerolineales bacterium]|nr:glutamate-5-semialdehyde dehydrogenase [Anaerolineales bacterium]
MLIEMAKEARKAARQLARATEDQKNAALLKLADLLEANQEPILAANETDLAEGRTAGLSEALLDRLALTPKRLSGIAGDLRNVVGLPDPVGEVFEETTRPNGLKIHKQRVPLGVIAVIYEARPNVTIDIAGLALKTGNAVMLRGGKETIHSNRALVALIKQALEECGLPPGAVQFIDSPDRALVGELLKMYEWIDMLIPRGGAGLHKFCRENSTIPVITGGIGVCHLYVDAGADLNAALPVIQNAKVQRPSVCNALDTLLVNKAVAEAFLPRVVERLAQDGVTFRAEPRALAALKEPEAALVQPAGPDDFTTEWLALILGLKVVDDLDTAIDHIVENGTGHSDGILTQTDENAQRFVAEVDSAAVYVNASTRFTDGAQFGLGAEVAVSTQRLHARGPMALKELTTYKWVVVGDNTVRA